MNCQLGDGAMPSLPADQKSRTAARPRPEITRDFARFSGAVPRHPHCISKRAGMSFHFIRKASTVLPLLALLGAGRSSAQTNTATNTSTGITGTTKLTSADFSLNLERYNSGNKSWIQMNDTEVKYFFNRGRCECGNAIDPDENSKYRYSQFFKVAIVPAANTTTKITQILQSSTSSFQGDCRLYGAASGTSCLDVNSTSAVVLPSVCTNLLHPEDYDKGFLLTTFSTTGGTRVESDPIPASTLFGSMLSQTCGARGNCNAPGNCATAGGTATIFFWAQSVSGISPDMNDELLSVNVVGTAPTAAPLFKDDATHIPVLGGNEALTVNWDWPDGLSPSGQNTSFLGLQVFCKRGADTQVFADGTFGASYKTARDFCPAANPDMSSYGEFHGLDPKYLCSGLLQPSTKSYRISGLQNGIYYGVGVAAIDRFGNITPITDVRYGKPIPTVDFYTEYREAGGNAEGGFCSFAGWRGRPGVIAIAGLGLVGLMLVRRRRKGPPGAATLVLVVAAGTLVAGPARAQRIVLDDMAPVDDDEEKYIPPEPTEPPPPKPPSTWTGSDRDFTLEIRFGLYTPNVDSEFQGAAARPNALLFGDSRRPMWQVEFDWEILQVFGTLAVGAQVGYWKENARACYRVPLEASGWKTCTQTDRSGDNTSLRLIPFAALLVYRMDEAAKRWGIPIVPYGKIGLNYTIWTVNNGDGRVPDHPKGGHGQGGTAGWQAAAGVALQLDFIDPAAAREFDSESGINHTYAFFEVDHVDGSGLYRSNVLHVGDNTWFAGLMFEF